MTNPRADEPRHPIRVVAQRTGLSPDALRAWERRYGVVAPSRSDGGQRLYSDADIERLTLLNRATAGGRSIGQLVDASNDELEELIAADRIRPGNGAGVPSETVAAHMEAAMEAVEQFHAVELEGTLKQAALTLGALPMLSEVLAPLLRRIGEEWHGGRITPAHEHAASVVVRRLLDWMSTGFPARVDAPLLVVATPQGERHEFGALLAAAAAVSAGWNALYLGADLPAADIARAARAREARAVGLSVVFSEDWNAVGREVAALRQALPPSIAVLVGGTAAAALVKRLELPHVRAVGDLSDLVSVIRGLTSAPAG